ncbi:transcription initiation factor TFIID subunit 11 isoform X2 [Daucus carota subsp. sativus]|nr:PREDICTED: transcription initiation factor TFIID subunit 11 [Daucus carota subsp. sativus]XP_017236646.1 PREDICTED: transcription initiation factor TFIID subunit 11 [Daucus carota subsp. sativus]
MMKQSKDPFEVAFEEQDESPPESPANSLPDYHVRDTQKQSVASHQLTAVNVQDDDNYDEDDDNEIDNDDGDTVIDRPPESTVAASSSMQVAAGTTATASRGKNKDDEEEELEEDNMDVELGKLQSTGDPDKMAKMQSILSQFTEEQMSRYESFRRSGFQKANMKRLLGSITGSPKISVPMTIVVSGIAKIYVGELVETARVVMTERNETGPIRPCHIREAYRRLKLEGKVPKRSVPRLFR